MVCVRRQRAISVEKLKWPLSQTRPPLLDAAAAHELRGAVAELQPSRFRCWTAEAAGSTS